MNTRCETQLYCAGLEMKNTVGYELRRGTPEYTGRGRKPGYSAKRGAVTYKVNRSRCYRHCIFQSDSAFIRWMAQKVLGKHRWSFDTCVGWARREHLFPAHDIPCTKTLYNLLWVTAQHCPCTEKVVVSGTHTVENHDFTSSEQGSRSSISKSLTASRNVRKKGS